MICFIHVSTLVVNPCRSMFCKCIILVIFSFYISSTNASHRMPLISLEKEVIKLYSGNLSNAIIEITKGLPADQLTIVFDNHTGKTFVNIIQKQLHIENIQTYLFNITQLQYQEQFFNYLLETMEQYGYAYCIFFCSHKMYEHILVELTENNIIHRNMLFIFYWGHDPFKRYFVRSLHESISTIVITNPRNDTYRFYYNQAISHRRHHLAMVNWWSTPGGLFRRPTLPARNEVYKDFKGKIFFVPVVHKPPWYFVKYNNNSIEVTGGRDNKLLDLLSKKLNFRYEYFDPNELAISNNSFQSALGLVWKREADFFLGDVTLTLDRSTLVEFSFLTLADSGAFITHAPSLLNEALALIRPFHWRLWPPVILTVMLAGPILYAFVAIQDMWRHKSNIKSHRKLFSNCVWFTTCIFLKQMGKEPTKSDKCRLYIITLSIAATYVIGDMYSANLTSMLASPGREKPINNLFQLEVAMRDNGYELYVEEHSSLYDLLQNGTGIYGRLWDLMKRQKTFIVDSVENGVKLVRDFKKVVTIAGRETLYFDIQRFGPTNFHLGEKLNTAYSAVALQLGCPFIDNINKVLMAVFEAGILTRMTENEYEMLGKQQIDDDKAESANAKAAKTDDTADTTSQSKQKVAKSAEDNEGLRPINIKMLQGAFYVVIMGHFLAACVLFVEIRIHIYLRNNPDAHFSFEAPRKLKIKCLKVRKRMLVWARRKYDCIKEHIALTFLDYVE